jgi:hypothetical protein
LAAVALAEVGEDFFDRLGLVAGGLKGGSQNKGAFHDRSLHGRCYVLISYITSQTPRLISTSWANVELIQKYCGLLQDPTTPKCKC